MKLQHTRELAEIFLRSNEQGEWVDSPVLVEVFNVLSHCLIRRNFGGLTPEGPWADIATLIAWHIETSDRIHDLRLAVNELRFSAWFAASEFCSAFFALSERATPGISLDLWVADNNERRRRLFDAVNNDPGISKWVDAALEKASRSVVACRDLTSGTSWDMSESSLEQATGLYQQMARFILGASSSLKKILDLAGRLAGNLKGPAIERGTGRGFGRDIASASPEDLASPFFEGRFVEEELDCEATTLAKGETSGPVIILVDLSGSTSATSYEGQSIATWLKAAALASGKRAKEMDREFAAIAYNSCPRAVYRSDIQSLQAFQRFITYKPSGGTEWAQPLDKAVEMIETNPNFLGADIIHFTDGACDVHRPWANTFNEKRAKLRIKVHTFMLEEAPTDDVFYISDTVSLITSAQGIQDAIDSIKK